MAAVGPGCADVWTQIGVKTSTHRTLLGRSPLNVIFMSIKISPRSATPWPRKKRDEQYIPFLLCSGHLFVIFLLCWRHSSSDVTANHLHDKVSHRQWTQFCIVYCELLWPLSRHLPMTWGPICTVCSCCTALQYLHTIYTLSTLYLLSSHP